MPSELAPGLIYHPGVFDRESALALVDAVRDVVRAAPLFTPRMPKTGTPFSVRMTNCGALGWVSDLAGYRYQPTHPETGQPWPPLPEAVRECWRAFSGAAPEPEACLVNFYAGGTRMGLHQDKDEEEFSTPVLSISLGDTAVFRYGGTLRREPTRSLKLHSGDVLVMGGSARLCFHGVDRIISGSSTLLPQGGRINLTVRRVTKA
jgi:DNA oxidative demethylase